MIRDPEIREAAERLAAEWAKTLGTLPMAAEVHAVGYALEQLADPTSPHWYRELLERLRWQRNRRGGECRVCAHELTD